MPPAPAPVASLPPPTAPLAQLRPTVVAMGLAAATSLVWVAWGSGLPGGRWLAVHVFTLGVVSNAILGFTAHFARTVLHVPDRGGDGGRFWLFNAGAVVLLVGLPVAATPLVAVGATATGAAVLWLYVDLRRMRRAALGPRFGFVVRAYERASSAFLHGAVLGLLMGISAVAGGWYGGLRLAHLHVNVLGWAGLTLLATLVFFGPTVMRTRIVDGADRRAARALRHGTTSLTAAVLLLLLLGLGGAVATGTRIAAAVGLAGFAAAASIICADVVRAARRARPSPHARHLAAVCAWFPVAAWVDTVAVAASWFWLLNGVGLAVLLGVLAQALLGALGYLAPMLWAAGAARRNAARQRLESLGRLRPVAFNLGVAAICVATAVGTTVGHAGAILLRAGWILVGGVAVTTFALSAAATRVGHSSGGSPACDEGHGLECPAAVGPLASGLPRRRPPA